jgi:hypothetical protein
VVLKKGAYLLKKNLLKVVEGSMLVSIVESDGESYKATPCRD